MSRDILPYLMTADEVGTWLCQSARAVLRLARKGELPSVLLPDGSRMFDPADLARWLDGCRTGGERKAVASA